MLIATRISVPRSFSWTELENICMCIYIFICVYIFILISLNLFYTHLYIENHRLTSILLNPIPNHTIPCNVLSFVPYASSLPVIKLSYIILNRFSCFVSSPECNQSLICTTTPLYKLTLVSFPPCSAPSIPLWDTVASPFSGVVTYLVLPT